MRLALGLRVRSVVVRLVSVDVLKLDVRVVLGKHGVKQRPKFREVLAIVRVIVPAFQHHLVAREREREKDT